MPKPVRTRSTRTEEIQMLANSTNPAARLLQQSAATLLPSAIVLAVAFLPAMPASAASATPIPPPSAGTSATTIQLRGHRLTLDPDGGPYGMRGDLIGRWAVLQTLPWYSLRDAPSTIVQAGKEHFLGCIDRNDNGRCDPGDPSGRMRFDYRIWMRYEASTDQLIRGNCAHWIISGTGDFARTRGQITMHDMPAGPNKLRTVYSGEIVLNAFPSEQVPLQDNGGEAFPGAPTNGC
jgi:hypothetical protein